MVPNLTYLHFWSIYIYGSSWSPPPICHRCRHHHRLGIFKIRSEDHWPNQDQGTLHHSQCSYPQDWSSWLKKNHNYWNTLLIQKDLQWKEREWTAAAAAAVHHNCCCSNYKHQPRTNLHYYPLHVVKLHPHSCPPKSKSAQSRNLCNSDQRLKIDRRRHRSEKSEKPNSPSGGSPAGREAGTGGTYPWGWTSEKPRRGSCNRGSSG